MADKRYKSEYSGEQIDEAITKINALEINDYYNKDEARELLNQEIDSSLADYYTKNEVDDGFIFVKWSDGVKSNVRCDTPTDEDIKVKAIFESLSDYEPDEEMFGPEIEKGSNENNKGQSEKNDKDSPPVLPKDSDDRNNPGAPNNSSGGGADDPSNIVIDGKTYYDGKVLDDAQKNSVDRANSDSNLTDKDKSFIDDYYAAIDR